MPLTRLAGVDGCRAGWVLARSNLALHLLEFDLYESFAELLAAHSHLETLIVVDIPIGLPPSSPRACDVQARKLLGPGRASSVFPAPSRAALAFQCYREASEANFAASGRRLSRQSHGILPKIRQVDALMTPELQARVREAHPEVTFHLLASRRGGESLGRKKTPAGEAQRLDLLMHDVPRFDPAAVRAYLGLRSVGRDDIIDAVACLVTARRIATGEAMVLPRGTVERDERGLRVEITA